MRIAFVNLGRQRDFAGNTSFAEPTHLLGMYGICKKGGHFPRIFQFGLDHPRHSLPALKRFKPDIVALSFFGEHREQLASARQILEVIPPPQGIVIGGPAVISLSDRIIKNALTLPGREKPPFFIEIEAGEPLIKALVKANFDFAEAYKAEAAAEVFSKNPQEGIYLTGHFPLPLDEANYLRPYSLYLFGREALVKANVGCWGRCDFCWNPPQPILSRHPASVSKEVNYLVKRKGARRIRFISPDFLAHPIKASDILGSLTLEGKEIVFGSRVDSLYFALRRRPSSWERLKQSTLSIELGVERFNPEWLVKRKKYRTLKQAERHRERLDYILNFFKDFPACEITFDLIPFDWQMTMEEFEEEIRWVKHYCSRYTNVRIPADTLANKLHYVAGSALGDKMGRLDFFAFNDPRLLFLNLKARSLFSRRQITTGEMLYFFDCGILIIKELVPEQFDLLVALRQPFEASGRSMDEIVEARMLSQLPPEIRAKVEELFTRVTEKIFGKDS